MRLTVGRRRPTPGDQYPVLCEHLAERLEKEKFDIRSAVMCYICAKNFPKTVSIWANTHVASAGSKKLALQDAPVLPWGSAPALRAMEIGCMREVSSALCREGSSGGEEAALKPQ